MKCAHLSQLGAGKQCANTSQDEHFKLNFKKEENERKKSVFIILLW